MSTVELKIQRAGYAKSAAEHVQGYFSAWRTYGDTSRYCRSSRYCGHITAHEG